MLAKILRSCVLVLAAGTAASSWAVTNESVTRDADNVDSVTTGLAARARTDVQIRRIRSLIIQRTGDREAAYRELERLQKNLRGEK